MMWIQGFCHRSFGTLEALYARRYHDRFGAVYRLRLYRHAVNELWDVREAYKSLLVDFDALTDEEIRSKRDTLIAEISRINKAYPGTDEKSFAKVQKEIRKYTFEDGESERLA